MASAWDEAARSEAATRAWKAAAWAAAWAACFWATSVAMFPLSFERVACWLASSACALCRALCAAASVVWAWDCVACSWLSCALEHRLGLVEAVDGSRDAVARHLLVLLDRGGALATGCEQLLEATVGAPRRVVLDRQLAQIVLRRRHLGLGLGDLRLGLGHLLVELLDVDLVLVVALGQHGELLALCLDL